MVDVATDSMSGRRDVVLRDGTPGFVRPVVASDRESLRRAFDELWAESRTGRFLYAKERLSDRELDRLSRPDGVDHVAYGLAVTRGGDEGGGDLPVAVGRFFREPDEPDLAEVAIVTADLWQGNGAATELMRSLSAHARRVGVRRWFAARFKENAAVARLLDRFGHRCDERDLGNGVVEAVYEIA